MKIKNFIIGCACLSVFPGCATIVTHGDKTMPIISTPDGATVEIKDSRMDKIVSKNKTPFQATFERGDGYFLKKKYILNLSKDGYISEKLEVSPSFNAIYIGNILVGGLIGILIVDPLTGDMWQYSEASIDIKLFPDTAEGRFARETDIKEKLAKEEELKKQQYQQY